MATTETRIHLVPQLFVERERTLIEHGPLSASAFLFDSGVCGIRLKNERGELVLLPFLGQQIWSAEFDGRNLTMKSMFAEPRPTSQMLATFGAFLVHCGATAIGGPSKEDTHSLHGELPNAPYQKAFLVAGQDDRGPYIGLGGHYQHTLAFSYNYVATPLVKLHAASARFDLGMTVANLKNSPMDLMYMAHINFKPVDDGRLVYSAPCTAQHVRVRANLPSHVRPRPAYVEFIQALQQQPEKANRFTPGLAFDPEVVFYLDYLADEAGWAHTMQVHPDGQADYVRHRPAQLDKAIRWMCRTADQDALGVEPSTSEGDGYLAEKAKGTVKVLPPHGEFHCDVEIGALAPAEAQQVEEKIKHTLEAGRQE
jgi:hypothetical protein